MTPSLHQTWLFILKDLVSQTQGFAEQAVQRILTHSTHYLSAEHQKTIQEFYNLYFSSEMDSAKTSVNNEVDDLIDKIREGLENNADLSTMNTIEDETSKKNRLTLSGIQKQLETLIQMEEGIRDRLVPVLTHMHFEDLLRQRLGRLHLLWSKTLECLGQPDAEKKLGAFQQELVLSLESNLERKLYYRCVLKKPLPKNLEKTEDDSSSGNFLHLIAS